MSWKNIKSFLILLFFIINAYLIFSTNGFVFKKTDATYVDKDTVSKTAEIIKKNYNVSLDTSLVPKHVDNLINTDVTNIIYTDGFKKSEYEFKTHSGAFETEIKTSTYSYNEKNAKEQFVKILKNMGIADNSYTLDITKSDEGLVCNAKEIFATYPIFNGRIKAVFMPKSVHLAGAWYIPQSNDTKNLTSSDKMTDITSVIIDMSEKCAKSDGTPAEITHIEFGYYVSSYDENVVSKSSSAIPCYMLRADDGLKYYYDASNGKSIKQED